MDLFVNIFTDRSNLYCLYYNITKTPELIEDICWGMGDDSACGYIAITPLVW
jgi:hypothetical protein